MVEPRESSDRERPPFPWRPVGHFLYRRLNFSPKFLLKNAFADKSRLTDEIHRHYLAPFPTPAQRQAPWVLARELMASNDWYEAQWQRRRRLRGKPMLVLWGMADELMPQAHLARWREAFPEAPVVALDGVGHFVAEEAPELGADRVRAFLEAGRGDAGRRGTEAAGRVQELAPKLQQPQRCVEPSR